MSHPTCRLKPFAVATTVAVAALAACQERKPTEAQTPAASSGEYPVPSETVPSSTSTPVAVPGKSADIAAKGTETGAVDGAKK